MDPIRSRWAASLLAVALMLASCSSGLSTSPDEGSAATNTSPSLTPAAPSCAEDGTLPSRLDPVTVMAGEPVALPLDDLTGGVCVESRDDRDFDLGSIVVDGDVVTFTPPPVPVDPTSPTEPWWGTTTATLCAADDSCARVDFDIYPVELYESWQTMDEVVTRSQEANGQPPVGVRHEPGLYSALERRAMSEAGTSPAGVASAQDAAGLLFMAVASRDFVEEATVRFVAAAACSGVTGAFIETQMITLDGMVYVFEAMDLIGAEVDAFGGTDPGVRYSERFRAAVDDFQESVGMMAALVSFLDEWADVRNPTQAALNVAGDTVIEEVCSRVVTSFAG